MTMNLKRAIGQVKDVQELRELRKAVIARIDLLQQREFEAAVDATWEKLKDLPLGTVLHCCAVGTFFGGNFQRGDSMRVIAVQPRARRIWVDANGKQYYFSAREAHRYELGTESPSNPMTPEARAAVEAAAERIAEGIAA